MFELYQLKLHRVDYSMRTIEDVNMQSTLT